MARIAIEPGTSGSESTSATTGGELEQIRLMTSGLAHRAFTMVSASAATPAATITAVTDDAISAAEADDEQGADERVEAELEGQARDAGVGHRLGHDKPQAVSPAIASALSQLRSSP